jgi:hypothetical protein
MFLFRLFQTITLIILGLCRGLTRDQAELMAHVISDTSITHEQAAMLITVSYYETGFRTSGGVVPFGVTSIRSVCRPQGSLDECASASLAILNRARRCSSDMERVFGFYHTGRCVADEYSIRQASTYRRVVRTLNSSIPSITDGLL